MAYVAPLGFSLEEIRSELEKIRHPMRIAVRRAKNPFNVGSIIRTSHSFLPKEIILIGDAPFYERAAMGMQRYENIRSIANETEFVAVARAENWHLSVLEKDDAQVGLWDAKLPENAVLVIGNEDDGVGKEILDAASEIIGIPMFGINHSYPMTVAAGMVLLEWARRQYGGPGKIVTRT